MRIMDIRLLQKYKAAALSEETVISFSEGAAALRAL